MKISSLSVNTLAACGAMAPCGASAALAPATCCQVIELRQYITYPGQRDVLTGLFEREFIDSQEALGIRVLAQFRDQNDPYRFTWLRGFPGMDERRKSLTDFYYGPLWKRYREQANATLYDNDDVLLLRPTGAGAGFALDDASRAPVAAPAPPAGLIVATLYHFKQEVTPAFIERFDRELAPLFERHGARILGRFVSEKSANTFAQLPVRETANVYVWFSRFVDRPAYLRYLAALDGDPAWRDHQFAPLYKSLARPPELLMLEPTARSLLR